MSDKNFRSTKSHRHEHSLYTICQCYLVTMEVKCQPPYGLARSAVSGCEGAWVAVRLRIVVHG
jgi:hypothetical protein